jgi:hypothetical protein
MSIKALWRGIRQVFSHVSVWIGGVSGIAGVVSDITGTTLLIPSYVWWAAAVIALAVAAVRIQMELDSERAGKRKPLPNISLEKVVGRITGPCEWDQLGTLPKTGAALVEIRQKARLGTLSVWGRPMPGNSDLYPLEPIPSEHWARAQIDPLDYLNSSQCKTSDITVPRSLEHYADLHFDLSEIDLLWPETRKSWFSFRNPIVVNRSQPTKSGTGP